MEKYPEEIATQAQITREYLIQGDLIPEQSLEVIKQQIDNLKPYECLIIERIEDKDNEVLYHIKLKIAKTWKQRLKIFTIGITTGLLIYKQQFGRLNNKVNLVQYGNKVLDKAFDIYQIIQEADIEFKQEQIKTIVIAGLTIISLGLMGSFM